MNEFSISKRRRDDRRPCRYALIIGLVLAMLFAVPRSVEVAPGRVRFQQTGIVTLLRGLPEITVVPVYLFFGSSQLLLTLSDSFCY